MAGPRHPKLVLKLGLSLLVGVAAAVYLGRLGDDGGEGDELGAGVSDLGRERAIPAALAYKVKSLDPAEDGWETEVLARRTNEILHRLEDVLSDPPPIEWSAVQGVAARGFFATRSDRRGSVRFESGALKVDGGPRLDLDPRAGAGPDAALAHVLSELVSGFATGARVRFKQFRVSPAESGAFTTEAYYQASGPAAGGGFDQHDAVWSMRWELAADGEPRLAQLALSGIERVHRSGPPLFEDVTAAVLARVPAYEDHLQLGVGYWNSTLDKTLGTSIFGHHGLAIADFDGDGLEDVYLCQPGGLPNLLLMREQDGAVRDAAAGSGVDFLDLSHAALAADFDGDGNQDLVVSTGALVILAGDGAGGFRDAARLETTDVYGLSAADYDLDGDLDLYVCRYASTDVSVPEPYHDANNGESNLLLRNDGAFRFSDATEETGLGANNERYSFAASWADYDGDGDVDLYVANDFGRNNLYRNTGGRFTDVAAEAGVEDISAGMSVSWGDCDEDGRLDLYVGNMFSSAGNRITYQRSFRADGDSTANEHYQRHARGNTLFANRGDGTFADVSLDSGAHMGRWAWASRFVDVDNDGREDLAIANGYLTGSRSDDL